MSTVKNKWAWVAAGSIFGLFILAPLFMILLEYHFGKHDLSFKVVAINFYRDAVRVDVVTGSLFILFMMLGGFLGYLLFRMRKGKTGTDRNVAPLEHFLMKGECNAVEFKSSFRWDHRLQKTSKDIEHASLKTLAAFMNTNGGILLIGVDDDSVVIGLNKDYDTLKKPGRDGFEQYIMQAVSLSLGTENCKFLDVSFVAIESRDVCMINVKKAGVSVFLKHQQNPHFFVRAGNSTRELNIQEALKYINASSGR